MPQKTRVPRLRTDPVRKPKREKKSAEYGRRTYSTTPIATDETSTLATGRTHEESPSGPFLRRAAETRIAHPTHAQKTVEAARPT